MMMLAYFETAVGWRELLKRTVRETQADNGLGLAAQLAYYFFLSLFPALLFLLGSTRKHLRLRRASWRPAVTVGRAGAVMAAVMASLFRRRTRE